MNLATINPCFALALIPTSEEVAEKVFAKENEYNRLVMLPFYSQAMFKEKIKTLNSQINYLGLQWRVLFDKEYAEDLRLDAEMEATPEYQAYLARQAA